MVLAVVRVETDPIGKSAMAVLFVAVRCLAVLA